MVARLQVDRRLANLEQRFALNEHDPFVLSLHVLLRRDARRTHDPLDDEIPVAENRIEALTRLWWRRIREEVAGSHASVRMAYRLTPPFAVARNEPRS